MRRVITPHQYLHCRTSKRTAPARRLTRSQTCVAATYGVHPECGKPRIRLVPIRIGTHAHRTPHPRLKPCSRLEYNLRAQTRTPQPQSGGVGESPPTPPPARSCGFFHRINRRTKRDLHIAINANAVRRFILIRLDMLVQTVMARRAVILARLWSNRSATYRQRRPLADKHAFIVPFLA